VLTGCQNNLKDTSDFFYNEHQKLPVLQLGQLAISIVRLPFSAKQPSEQPRRHTFPTCAIIATPSTGDKYCQTCIQRWAAVRTTSTTPVGLGSMCFGNLTVSQEWNHCDSINWQSVLSDLHQRLAAVRTTSTTPVGLGSMCFGNLTVSQECNHCDSVNWRSVLSDLHQHQAAVRTTSTTPVGLGSMCFGNLTVSRECNHCDSVNWR
jgi:hypothetical protein